MRGVLGVLLALAAGGSLTFGSANAAIISYPSNDGFEGNDRGTGAGAYLYGSIPGWTSNGGAGQAANGSDFGVNGATNGNHDGTLSASGQAAFLQGGDGTLNNAPNTGAWISQTVTLPGGQATLNFSDESRPGLGPNGINIFLDAVQVGPTIFPSSSSGFIAEAVSLGVLSAGAHTIAFAGNNTLGGDKTSFVDNVSITSVPEPASFVLLGVSAVGLFFTTRRRRSA